jgi:hypothetical protein
MVYDPVRANMVYFGGVLGVTVQPYSYDRNTYTWDYTSWRLAATTGPTARFAHAMTYDLAHSRAVTFGGNNGSGVLYNDTWTWDGTTWTTLPLASPPTARFGAAIAYDEARHTVVIFGGQRAGSVILAETWEWDTNTTSWVNRALAGPSARLYASMTYDSIRHVCVLFGGLGPSNALYNDTWEYDGVAWTQRTPSPSNVVPSARYSGAMAFDSIRGVTTLLGGDVFSGSVSHSIWEWNGSGWRQRTNAYPGVGVDSSIAFNPSRAKFLVYGATDTNYEYRTYEGPSTEVQITQDPVAQAVVLGQTAILSVQARGSGVLTYQWYKTGPTTAMVDGGRVSGSQTDTLIITNYQASDAHGYYVTVTNDCGTSQSTTANLTTCNLSIAQQPAPVALPSDQTASFSVTAGGTGPFTYQWYKGATPLTDAGKVSGSHAATLQIASVRLQDEGQYHCVVTSACGSLSSANAALTTTCGSHDFNGDGDVGTDADIQEFFSCLGGTCCSDCDTADFNRDGDLGTDADIDSFFRVLSGGAC